MDWVTGRRKFFPSDEQVRAMSHEDIRRRGFKDRTRLDAARQTLADRISPHGRTERIDLVAADGRVAATALTAGRDVPHYDRAAMDGWAVMANDTHGASDRAPNRLTAAEAVTSGTAVPVNTGDELPDGADAVVMKERVEVDGDRLDVFASVPVGANVGSAGEDIEAGFTLVEAGARLRPSDLGLLKAAGIKTVKTIEPARVAVIPTGDELVDENPDPGEIVETNALTVSQFVRRWGGNATYRDIIPDDRTALREAITADLDHDVIVTTGGSSVGDRDLLPEIVNEMGEVFVHGVALKPGHPVALGEVDGTPVLILPGYPVACIVNAMQFLRPSIAWLMDTDPYPIPTTDARLDGKLRSDPGHRTFARVSLDRSDSEWIAQPVRASGAGVLSSVTEADGWIVVPEAREGIPAGETVTVERWEWPP